MLIAAPVARCDDATTPWDDTPRLGRRATCPASGHVVTVVVEGNYYTAADRRAVRELDRTCPDLNHHHYQQLAPGVALEWLDRGTWRRAYLIKWRAVSVAGDLPAGIEVRVTYPPGDDGLDTATVREKAAARRMKGLIEKVKAKLIKRKYRVQLRQTAAGRQKVSA